MKHVSKAALVALAATSLIATGATSADATARKFANCTAMHKVYPHGVGKYGAHDRTSGTPVTSFKRNNALYYANSFSDRDKDKIACEQR